jgi:hypothetical protein
LPVFRGGALRATPAPSWYDDAVSVRLPRVDVRRGAGLASAALLVPLALVASCLSTTGLSGGSEPDTFDAGEPDTALPNPNPCGKDLAADAVNCGSCGNVCAFGVNSFPRCEAGGCKIGCNSGFANCDGDDANGCETNLQNDAANCAACGRGCLGGACSVSVCQPTVIGTVQARLAGITVDATNVFYGSNGAAVGTAGITRIEKDGKNALAIVSNQARAIYGIASDASFVYFSASNQQSPPTAYDGAILKVAKDGQSAPQTVASAQGISSSFNLVVTTDFAYWTNFGGYDSVSGTYLGSVVRCALPGGCGKAPTSLAGAQNGPYGLAIDATSVYYGIYGNGVGNAYKCPLAGCGLTTPTKISPTSQTPYWMAADPTSVYWATDTAIVKSNKAMIDALPVASGLKSPRSLIIDAKNLYWVSSSGGVVQSCALAGCNGTPTNLASGLSCPGYLAQDDDALYWTTGSGCSQASGTVMKVRK